jgi:hypothetical protein
MGKPGIGWILYVAHACNPVLSMKHRIAEMEIFGEEILSPRYCSLLPLGEGLGKRGVAR